MSNTMIKKRAFAEALRRLMKKKPFSKISVTDICKQCDVSRKSFYYHFKDKYDLVDWIFYTYCGFSLEAENISDFWMFYKKLTTYIYNNKEYYVEVCKVEGAFSFRNTLSSFLIRNFEPYTHHYFEDHEAYSSKEKRDDCLGLLSATFIAAIITWITYYPHLTPDQFIEVTRFDKLIQN